MLDGIEKAIEEVQQPRSRFQLERFVLGQHPTKEMQYYQVCIELQDMLYKYELAELNAKKANLKVSRLRATGDELDELKAQEIELGQKQAAYAIAGAKKEIAHLIDIWNSFDIKYSRQEIEDAQPDYWESRLTSNAKAMLLGSGAVNPSHIEAMDQAGILDKFVEQRIEDERELRDLES